MRLSVGLAALALAIAGLSDVVALADHVVGVAGGNTYVRGNRTIVTDRSGGVRVRCAHGQHVLGGGFAGDTSHLAARTSAPIDGADPDRSRDDGWRGYFHASAPDQAQVFAICSESKPVYVRRAKTAASGGRGTVTAQCPRSMHVLSGGGSAARPGSIAIQSSFPVDSADHGGRPDDGWRVAFTGSLTSTTRLTGFAVCSKEPPDYVARSETLAPRATASVLSRCGSRTHVVGVGGRLAGAPASSRLRAVAPSTRSEGSVPVFGAEAEGESRGGRSKTLTAFAICR